MALVLVPILIIVMWFALAGTVRGSDYWAQAFVGWLANVLRHVPLVGSLAAGQVTKLSRWLANKLGAAALLMESHIAGFFAGVLTVVKFVAFWTFAWPVEMLLTTKWLLHDEIPRLIHALKTAPGVLTRIVTRTIGLTRREWAAVKTLAASVARSAVHIPLGALSLPDLNAIRWLRHNYKALVAAAAVAGGLAMPWPTLRRLMHRTDALSKRLHRVEALLGVTAFAAIMARVLGLASPRCLRGGNVGRIARGICGMPLRWFNDVLALLTDFFVLTEICEVIGWLEAGFGVVANELTAFVSETGMALCHGDYDAPGKLQPPTLYTPPLSGFTPDAL